MSNSKPVKLWETENIVIEFLEKLRKFKVGDNTEEMLEDTDLGWEIDHIDHVINYVDKERGNIE